MQIEIKFYAERWPAGHRGLATHEQDARAGCPGMLKAARVLLA